MIAATTTDSYRRRLRWVMIAYVLGFIGILVFFGLLEQFGVPNIYIGYAFFLLPLAGYVVVGLFSRPTHLSDFYVAGRRVPTLYNGMANAANWMSAASFVGMAGSLFILGYDGLVFILGWTAGFVLLAVLIAPYLRRSGAITVPEFLANRFDSRSIRLLSVLIIMACLFAYLVAQIYAIGLITSRLLGIDFDVAMSMGFAVILLCCVIGGMRSVTWTQVAQFVVIIIAYLVPLILLSAKKYGIPFPYLTYGQALHDIAALEQSLLQRGLAQAATLKPHTMPFQTYTNANFIALAASLMFGTAVMPHLLTRCATTPDAPSSRTSVAWTLLFVLLLYLAAPAYAAFIKLEIYTAVLGLSLTDLPLWIFNFGTLGLITICGKAAANAEAVVNACRQISGHPGILRLHDLTINTDVIVLATPELSGFPYFVAGLMAAGALAAGISTATGLLITMATALSHDVYFKTMAPSASPQRRLWVARFIILVVALAGVLVAAKRDPDILSMVAWAFSIAASSLFAAIVLGIWWKGTTSKGALCGMLVGFATCMLYLVTTRYYPVLGVKYLGMNSFVHPLTALPVADVARVLGDPALTASGYGASASHPLAGRVGWFNINSISAAVFGVPASLAATVLVSWFTRKPSEAALARLDALRSPDTEAMFADHPEERMRL